MNFNAIVVFFAQKSSYQNKLLTTRKFYEMFLSLSTFFQKKHEESSGEIEK